MPQAQLSGAMKLPISQVDTKSLKRQLTLKYRPMGAEADIKVPVYAEDGKFLSVPRQFGIRFCNQLQIEWEDCTSEGHAARFPRVPSLRDYQEEPVADLLDCFGDYYDVVFRARTGFGKTIASLYVAAQFGRTTLIVVDQENLRDQWIDETLIPHFGFKREDIGIVQGTKCDYKGKPVVVAMIQTLTQKRFARDFYDYFGFVIFDEVHTTGAPTFQTTLSQFSASRRLSVSATPKRRDGLQKALDYNLGPVRVAADAEHDESAVYILRHPTVYSWYANISPKVGRIITEVSEDGPRNLMVAEAIQWLYESGRDVLVLSDRIEQLNEIKELLYYLGMEEEEIGLYVGMHPVWQWVKDPKPPRRPQGWEPGTDYTPVKLTMVQKKTPKERLKWIKEHARIILATYGMFQKGVDVPRLTAGIDITPRGVAEQVHGRIKRGKVDILPIWVTIVDENNYRLLHSFGNRVRDYLKDNAVLYEWNDDGSTTPCRSNQLLRETESRVTDLKAHRIETNRDGINTLLTPESVKKQRRLQEAAIVERFRSVRARSREDSLPQEPSARSRTKTSNSPPPSRPTRSPKRRLR